jgi:rhodanese-related sulfurtransferase
MGVETIAGSDARVLIAGGDAIVVDIRSSKEWAEGHIPGSRNVPDPGEGADLGEVPEGKRLLVIDADGSRAGEAAEALAGEGREVAAVDGGMKSWDGDDLPMQPSADTEPPLDDPPDEPLEEKIPTG